MLNKVGEFLLNLFMNILIILGVLFVIVISIPLLIIGLVATIIYKIFEAISNSSKWIWVKILDSYKSFLDLFDDNEEG